MSKGNMLLGHARGKVGDLVFSRTNGQQVTRARAAVVKNPQTKSQMIQRILLNTVSQAYSKMCAITDHSFEGVQPGQKSMSLFNKKNLDALRSRLAALVQEGWDIDSFYAVSPIGTNIFSPNSYTVSQGSLPEVKTLYLEPTKHKIALSTNTYQGVLDEYGLERGDQITIIAVHGGNAFNQTFFFARIILDPMDENGNQLPLDTEFVSGGGIVAANPRNEGVITNLAYSNNAVEFGFNQQALTCSACIVSRKNTDGTWKRSNSTMTSDDRAYFGQVYNMEEALDLIESGGLETINPLYLNNAGKGKLAKGGDAEGITVQDMDGKDVTIVSLSPRTGKDIQDEDTTILCGISDGGEAYMIAQGFDNQKANYGKKLASYQPANFNSAWIAGIDSMQTAHKNIMVTSASGDFAQWLVNHGVSIVAFIG